MKTPKWVVKQVEPQNNYTLMLTFASGEKRVYNARPLLKKTIYEKLKNIKFFLEAKADCGTVIWNDDIDIAPEHLYEHSCPIESDLSLTDEKDIQIARAEFSRGEFVRHQDIDWS